MNANFPSALLRDSISIVILSLFLSYPIRESYATNMSQTDTESLASISVFVA